MIGLKQAKRGSNEVALVMHAVHQRTQGLLVNMPKRMYQLQRLHVQDNQGAGRNSYSGI